MALQHLLLYAIPLFLVSMWIEFKLSDEGDHAGYTRTDFISNMNIGMVAILFGLVASSFSISLYVAQGYTSKYPVLSLLFNKIQQ